jgi:predicted dehydrogenase
MRIAFTGVSHWHLFHYLDPVLELPDATVVGVSDPDLAVAQEVADRTGSKAWADWRELISETAPDFVFVLGRHGDMAEVCRQLIEQKIPFAVEKPAGLDSLEVDVLARLAAENGAFAAVPFVFRQSQMLDVVHEIALEDAPLYMSYKFVAGSFDRYRNGSDWMLERKTAGGGALINLGVHFLDLSRHLMGPDISVVGSMMSNALAGLDVEDHAAVLMRSGSGGALVETGYIYPAPHMTFDMHFSIRTGRHHIAAKDGTGIQIITDGKAPVFHPMPMTNVEYYPLFVADVLERVLHGEKPVADLSDMASVMTLLEAAYAMSPLPPTR